MKPDISISSDYAVMEMGSMKFYYGYEFDRRDDEEVWGFEVIKMGKSVFRLKWTEEQGDKFNCAERLLYGIGVYLSN